MCNMKEHLRNVGIASIAAFPFVGGSLAYILDKQIPDYVQNQYGSFVKELEEELKEIDCKVDYSKIETPEFYSLFQKVLNEVILSQMTLRKELYKNMLINSIISEKKWDKTDFFLYIISSITEDEIEELFLLYTKGEQVNMIPSLIKQYPKYNDYIISFASELVRYRLVEGNKLSLLGKEFCNYVFKPLIPKIMLYE